MCGYVGPLVHLGPKQKRTLRWLDPESRMLLVQSQLDIRSCFNLSVDDLGQSVPLHQRLPHAEGPLKSGFLSLSIPCPIRGPQDK